MQPIKLFIIFALVLALGVWLLPSKTEHIAMLLQDQQYKKAFDELTRLYEAGDRQPQTLMRLYELHELYGNEEKMQGVLNVYRARHPDDIFVGEKLADLYFRSNQYEAYLKQLEELIDKKPKAEYARKLLAQLELGGRSDEERRLLEKFRSMPFFSGVHAGRLGLLELNAGHQGKALDLLRRMDQLGRDDEDLFEPRLSLFRLLVQTGLIEEAYQRALDWMRFEKNDANLFVMTRQLRARGHMDLAIDLAMEARYHRAGATFILTDLLVAQKRFEEARMLLGAWRQASTQPSTSPISVQ